MLARREDDIAKEKTPGIQFDKITFEDLAECFLRDYRINQKKSLAKAQRSVNHLKASFERIRVPQITTPRIKAFIENRLNEGAANATINRELAALKRMMNIGAKQTPPMVERVPLCPCWKKTMSGKGSLNMMNSWQGRQNDLSG